MGWAAEIKVGEADPDFAVLAGEDTLTAPPVLV